MLEWREKEAKSKVQKKVSFGVDMRKFLHEKVTSKYGRGGQVVLGAISNSSREKALVSRFKSHLRHVINMIP